MVDDGEGCDDANDIDADGCNSDCTLSGSLLWEFEFPADVDATHVRVDAEDQIHVAGTFQGAPVLFLFSPDGDVLSQTPEPVSVEPPEGTEETDLFVEGFALGDDGAPIYSLTHAFFDAEGSFLDVSYELVSAGPERWNYIWPEGTTGLRSFDVASDGSVYGAGFETLRRWSPTGALLLSESGQHWRNATAFGPGGIAFAHDDVAAYGEDGTLRWSEPWPGGNLDHAYSASMLSNGDLLVMGDVTADFDRGQQLRLAQFGPEGTLVQEWLWPDDPGNVAGGTLMASTPDDHIVTIVTENGTESIWKLNSDFSTRWRIEEKFGFFLPFVLRSDSEGAVIGLSRSALSKRAP